MPSADRAGVPTAGVLKAARPATQALPLALFRSEERESQEARDFL